MKRRERTSEQTTREQERSVARQHPARETAARRAQLHRRSVLRPTRKDPLPKTPAPAPALAPSARVKRQRKREERVNLIQAGNDLRQALALAAPAANAEVDALLEAIPKNAPASTTMMLGNEQAAIADPLHEWCRDFFLQVISEATQTPGAANVGDVLRRRHRKVERTATAMALLNWYVTCRSVRSLYDESRAISKSEIDNAIQRAGGDITKLDLEAKHYSFLAVRALIDQGYIRVEQSAPMARDAAAAAAADDDDDDDAHSRARVDVEEVFADPKPTRKCGAGFVGPKTALAPGAALTSESNQLLRDTTDVAATFRTRPLGAEAPLYAMGRTDLGQPYNVHQLASHTANRCVEDSCQETLFSRGRRGMTGTPAEQRAPYTSRCKVLKKPKTSWFERPDLDKVELCDTRVQPPPMATDFGFDELVRMIRASQQFASKVDARYKSWTAVRVGVLQVNAEYVLSARNFLRTLCGFLRSLQDAPFLTNVAELSDEYVFETFVVPYYDVRMNFFRMLHTGHQILNAQFPGATLLRNAAFTALRRGARYIAASLIALGLYVVNGATMALSYFVVQGLLWWGGVSAVNVASLLSATGLGATLVSGGSVLLPWLAASTLSWGAYQYGGALLDYIGLARYFWSQDMLMKLKGLFESAGRWLATQGYPGLQDWLRAEAGAVAMDAKTMIASKLDAVAEVILANKEHAFDVGAAEWVPEWFSPKPNWTNLPAWVTNKGARALEVARIDKLAGVQSGRASQAFTDAMQRVYSVVKDADIVDANGQRVFHADFLKQAAEFSAKINLSSESLRAQHHLGQVLYNNSRWMETPAVFTSILIVLFAADGALAAWASELTPETKKLAEKFQLQLPPTLLTLLHYDTKNNVWTL